ELYPIPGSLDEALSGYSAIIAKPIQRVGLLVEPGEIATWVKFKVSETISNVKRDPAQYALGFAPPPPADILPVDQGEILVFHGGGTATIDGIEITSVESGFPRFDDDNLYLLFLTFDPNNQQIARLEIGTRGVFKVDNEGKASPFNNVFPNHINKDLKSR